VGAPSLEPTRRLGNVLDHRQRNQGIELLIRVDLLRTDETEGGISNACRGEDTIVDVYTHITIGCHKLAETTVAAPQIENTAHEMWFRDREAATLQEWG
jgi:hypothetical protein